MTVEMKMTNIRRTYLTWIVLSSIAALASSAGGQEGKPQSPGVGPAISSLKSQAAVRSPRYRIGHGDTFDLVFAYTPELNQTVAVQPDGYITLKNVGTFAVEGKTVPELEQTIQAAYSTILHDAVISVSLKDFDRPHFIVGGQVAKPGRYDLRGDITVSQALQLAGGFTEEAKHSQVILFRPVSNGQVESRLIDVKKMLRSKNVNEDSHLLPGDTLYVPQNAISKIRRYMPSQSVGLAVNALQY